MALTGPLFHRSTTHWPIISPHVTLLYRSNRGNNLRTCSKHKADWKAHSSSQVDIFPALGNYKPSRLTQLVLTTISIKPSSLSPNCWPLSPCVPASAQHIYIPWPGCHRKKLKLSEGSSLQHLSLYWIPSLLASLPESLYLCVSYSEGLSSTPMILLPSQGSGFSKHPLPRSFSSTFQCAQVSSNVNMTSKH